MIVQAQKGTFYFSLFPVPLTDKAVTNQMRGAVPNAGGEKLNVPFAGFPEIRLPERRGSVKSFAFIARSEE